MSYYTTFTTAVIDMALVAPALLAAGILMLRRAPAGYLLAATMLVFTCILGTALFVGGIAQLRAGVMSVGQAIGFTAPFVVLTLFALGFTIRLFREHHRTGRLTQDRCARNHPERSSPCPTHPTPAMTLIAAPQMALTHTVEIAAPPAAIWPWIVQLGYHRAGWYIDTWWDRWEQDKFWPRLVPPDERGFWQAAAEDHPAEYQGLKVGDTVPDGPPGTAYYIVTALEPERYMVMLSKSHVKYMAPRSWWGTPRELSGAFTWAFILEPLSPDRTRLISRWRGVSASRAAFMALVKPVILLADRSPPARDPQGHSAAVWRGRRARRAVGPPAERAYTGFCEHSIYIPSGRIPANIRCCQHTSDGNRSPCEMTYKSASAQYQDDRQ